MLRPSYSELMEVINNDRDLDSKITSRYTIVIAAAKRARQIVNGEKCDNLDVTTDKAVSIAVSELSRGLIKLFPDGMPPELSESEEEENLSQEFSIEDRAMLDAGETDDLEDLTAMQDEDEDM